MPSLMAIIGANLLPFRKAMDDAAHVATITGRKIEHAFGDVLSEKLGEFASIAVVEETMRRVIEYGDRISELSKRLGISTDAVQQWNFALKMAGSSIEAAVPFFEHLAVARQKALQGSEDSTNAFKRLGVTLEELKTLRIENIAEKIAEAFKVGDPQALVADLREVGGRGAGEMVIAFRDGLSDLLEEAKKAGVVIGESVVEGLAEASERAKTVFLQFTAGVAPAVAWITKAFQSIWSTANLGMRGIVGFATGGIGGAKDLMNEYFDQQVEAEREMEKRREQSRKNKNGPLNIEDEAAAKKAKVEEGKLERMREELRKLADENDLKAMDKPGQIQELMRRRKEQLSAMQSSPNEEGIIKAAMAIEHIDGQLRELQKVDKDPRQKMVSGELTSLQKLGAYVSPASITLIDVNKKMESHLRDIKNHLSANQRNGAIGGFGRPRF